LEVGWVIGGKKNIIWSKNKSTTENSHSEIVQLLKQSQPWIIYQ